MKVFVSFLKGTEVYSSVAWCHLSTHSSCCALCGSHVSIPTLDHILPTDRTLIYFTIAAPHLANTLCFKHTCLMYHRRPGQEETQRKPCQTSHLREENTKAQMGALRSPRPHRSHVTAIPASSVSSLAISPLDFVNSTVSSQLHNDFYTTSFSISMSPLTL
jgi:hypothetical protein